jgi:hypothetical protein
MVPWSKPDWRQSSWSQKALEGTKKVFLLCVVGMAKKPLGVVRGIKKVMAFPSVLFWSRLKKKEKKPPQGRTHGGAEARRKQREEPTTGQKGNWRVPCFCLCVKHPWFPTGVLHCPGHPSCAGA